MDKEETEMLNLKGNTRHNGDHLGKDNKEQVREVQVDYMRRHWKHWGKQSQKLNKNSHK